MPVSTINPRIYPDSRLSLAAFVPQTELPTESFSGSTVDSATHRIFTATQPYICAPPCPNPVLLSHEYVPLKWSPRALFPGLPPFSMISLSVSPHFFASIELTHSVSFWPLYHRRALLFGQGKTRFHLKAAAHFSLDRAPCL